MARVAGLDVDLIVGASLTIADVEGLDRLTMRRLSTELGVTPMAIYHHVPGKEELLDLVADESLRALPLVDVGGDPNDELVAWAFAFHRLLVDHPALAQVMARRRLERPVAAEAAARLVELAERAGVDDDRAVDLLVSLVSFVLGSSLYRISRLAAGAERGDRRLPELEDAATPSARRVRGRLGSAALNDEQFLDGVRRLVAGYLA